MGDVLDIDTAGRDIGRDEDFDGALLELAQGLGPGVLGLVAVDCLGGDVHTPQPLDDSVGAVLGLGEDQHPLNRLVLKQTKQKCLLAFPFDGVDALRDRIDRGRLWRGLDQHRVGQ